MFVFSNAGKPVFSRYGDEHLMSTFFAAAQAILSFVGDKWGDRLLLMEGSVHRRRKSIWKGREKSGGGGDENNRSGVVACVGVLNPRAVFLEKGPLTFVCVSRTNEPTDLLRVQLELLHSQFISILTLGIERAFSFIDTDCMKYFDTSNAAKSEEDEDEETFPTRRCVWDGHARTDAEYNM